MTSSPTSLPPKPKQGNKRFIRLSRADMKKAEQNREKENLGALVPAPAASVKVIEAEVEVIEPDESDLEDLSSAETDFEEFHEPDEKGLAPTAPLTRYLNELKKYSLLTLFEEQTIARQAFENNDIQARQRLVTANLRLVVKIAMEYRRAYNQILDLIQEGNAGLVQAVNRFNPYRGVKLSTYAAWWIRAYILKFLMDNKSLVRMGTTEAQRKLFFRLRGEAEKMYALTQRFDANLLAEKIGVKESEVIEMQQRLTKNDVSLDAPVGEEEDRRQVDLLPHGDEDADDRIEREQLLQILDEHLQVIEQGLNERDLYIFRKRILADDPVTLQDVGDQFSITRERARQLEARIIKKIKERLQDYGIGKNQD